MPRRDRVLVYVEDERGLLVFDHRDHPHAGTQVPAGGVQPGENLAGAARREVLEETGVELEGELTLLGSHEHLDGLGRPALTYCFRAPAPAGLPQSWQHAVAGDGDDAGLVFDCRFDPAPTLWDVQSVFLHPGGSTMRPMAEFVPPDFDVPTGLETQEFVLEPLGPQHNEPDYAAWTSSIEHIASTPGFAGGSWPHEMTLDENRGDLERHADDFRSRKGFTYTVLDPASRDVIGCVYIYPSRDTDDDATTLSWVRASHAHLDTPLWRAVSGWLESDWPFGRVQYAAREEPSPRSE